MSVYLSLPRARIVHLKGYGHAADPSADHFRVELADVGELAVYQPGLLREKKVISMSIAHLSLTTNTNQVTTGGGYIGGGVGIAGAAVGIYQARILNSLSRRIREYTLLGAYTTLPNGTHRDAVFAFQNLDESQLRDKLAAAIVAWSDGYVTATLNTYREQPVPDNDLQATYAAIDLMHERGMLDSVQALTLCSDASRPFIAAMLQNLRAGKFNQHEAQRVTAEINNLRHNGRLTEHQARQIHDQLTKVSTPRPAAEADVDRHQQVQALAELRKTGALTEAEFQAEKALLLHADI